MKARVIAAKEALVARRGKRLWALSFGVIAVMVASMAIGLNRTATFETERAAAAENDKAVWLDQGVRNPHKAAHFSRYVFKPIPTLASFDPGAIDFAGIAVWMEAHIQNPSRFRRAESTGDLSRFVGLSPAWVLQVIMPLIVILLLFGSYAGEREDGTLRQVMSYGVSPGSVFKGKLRGASSALLKLLLPVFALITIAVFVFDRGYPQEDLPVRLLGIVGIYGIYLFAFAMLTIGVSALSPSRRSAAVSLLAIWCLVTVLLPRFANDAAVTSTPQPDSYQTWKDLEEIKAEYWGVIPAFGIPLTDIRKREMARFLEKFQVANVEDAPVPWSAWELQASEEYSDPLYDAYYAGLNDRYGRQEDTRFWLTALSPTISVMALSSGLSGSDRLHHYDFVKSAEEHRRVVIRQLNEDLLYNSGADPMVYESPTSFWGEVADYHAGPPPLTNFTGSYLPYLLVMVLWASGAFLFARWAAFRAANMETAV
ncbi:MAG: DUF3526 domain-containing protein [Acidobacteria bacterium]|nr:DUF3526 domain-containing protein [Acidobacteriota bacterium]